GIPFSPGLRIAGIAGKIVGGLCLVFGLVIVWFSGRVFGPKEEDAVAHAVVRMFPFGVAAYAIAQVLWFSLPHGRRPETADRPPQSRRRVSKKLQEGIIQCPHCGKQMVDTAQERCRFCGEALDAAAE